MALLFFDGFDTAQASPLILKPGWTLTSGTAQLAAGRTGSGNSFGVTTSGTLTLGLPTPAATVIAGTAVRIGVSGTLISTSTGVFQLAGDNNTTTHLTVNFDTSGHLVVRRGASNATIVATSTQVFPADNSWHYVEVKATVADSGGTWIVHVDGVEWINYTGDTRNAGTNTTIDAVRLLTPSASNVMAWDDLYVCDGTGTSNNDFLGDVKIESLLPNGNGASSQWVGTDGNSTDNYLLVDDNPANTTDYVASSTVGNRDLYTMSDLTVTAGTVLATQVSAFAAKSDAGTANIKTLTRSSAGTVAASGVLGLSSTTFTPVVGPIRTTDPDGAGWTITSVNAVQAGVETA